METGLLVLVAARSVVDVFAVDVLVDEGVDVVVDVATVVVVVAAVF